MKVGIWAPVYGGWLRIKNHQYRPSFAVCNEIASRAETSCYDYIYVSENYLNVVYGPSQEVADAWAYAAALAANTSKISIVVATKPGFHSPLPLARMAHGINHISNNRLSINIVCGWWKKEFTQCGVEYLDHQGRYQRASEFTQCLKQLWTGENTSFNGKYFLLQDALIAMEDLEEGRIPIWISGQSTDAQRLVAQYGDVFFIDSMPDEELEQTIQQIRDLESKHRNKVKIAMSVFVILDETKEQAERRYMKILSGRQQDLIEGFKRIMAESGATMWKGLTDEQMVDSNCGFDASLIGDRATILNRLKLLQGYGVDILLCQFENMLDDAEKFGKTVLPQLRAA